MPSSKARKGRDKVAKELKAQGFLNLCTILAQDEKLLSLISECKDFAILNAYVFTRAQGTTCQKHLSETNAFARVSQSLLPTVPANYPYLFKTDSELFTACLKSKRITSTLTKE